MRKNNVQLTLVLLFVMLFLGACAPAQNNSVQIDTPNTEEVTDTLEIAEDAFQCETELVDSPNINMELKYPRMISSDKDINYFVNNEIKAKVGKFKKQWEHEFLDGEVTVELNYDITYYSENFISIIFKGYGNMTTAAHPSYDVFSLNLDLDERCVKTLSDMVVIDEHFINVFKNAVEENETTELIDEILSNDVERFLKTIDTESSNNISYYTEDEVVVSVHFPYIFGDFVEIRIKQSCVQTK